MHIKLRPQLFQGGSACRIDGANLDDLLSGEFGIATPLSTRHALRAQSGMVVIAAIVACATLAYLIADIIKICS